VTGRSRRPRLRHRLLIGTLLGLSLAAGGCTSGAATTAATGTPETLVPVSGGALDVGIDQAPTGCNPNTVSGDDWATRMILEAVLPSVSTTSNQGVELGNSGLVQSAELVNTTPQTVVYTIDPKAVWSDGVPITADDFVYAWQEQRGAAGNPFAPASDAASILGYRDIASVTGSNKGKTVTVVFKNPYSDWEMLFDYLLPAHVMRHVGWDPACPTLDPTIDLSGGPFEIHAVTPTQVTLVANPRWWGNSPVLSSLDIRIAQSPEQLAHWMRSGAVRVAEPASFSPSFLLAVSNDPTLESEVTPSSTFLQLVFSMTDPATSSLDVREALAHAVDRRSLVDTVAAWADASIAPATSHIYAQNQGPYPSPPLAPGQSNALDVPPTTGTTTTTVPPSPHAPFPVTADPVQTADLLTAAGYTQIPDGVWRDASGKLFQVRLTWDESDGWAAQSAADVTADLRAAGIAVQTIPAASARQAGQALSLGIADLAVLPYTATPYPSQSLEWYTESLGSPGQNGSADWGNLDDPTLTNLLLTAASEANPGTAQMMYAQADAVLWRDMAALPLFSEPSVLAWSQFTISVGPNANGPSLFWYPESWGLQQAEPTSEATSTTSSSS
jgi:peptide/nickel transport system substrate-binding protein